MRTLLATVVVLLVALFAVSAAQAGTFHVTSTEDAGYVNDPADGTCESTATGNPCTLRAAIDEANATPEADTITVDAGRYTLTGSSSDNGNLSGDLDVYASGAVTIVGATSDPRDTVVSGGGNDRVFQVLTGEELTLRDLSVTDGHAISTDETSGGGILLGGFHPAGVRQDNLATQLHLDNTKVVNNVSDGLGGGIADDGCSNITLANSHVDRNTSGDLGGGIAACGELTAADSTIDGNSNTRGDGGGLAFEGAEVNLTDTSVSNNRAYSGNGGGIYDDGNSLTIDGGQVNDNLAGGQNGEVGSGGGGIYSDGGTLDITGTDITDNVTQNNNGGGIYYNGDDDVNITDATIHSNNAEYGDGGGIYNGLGDFTIGGTDITSNSAGGDGGGIYSDEGDVTISGSTIDDNGDHQRVFDSGGGIYGGDGDLSIDGSSVSGNSTRLNGGGIWWSGGDVTVEDSSVNHNEADNSGGGIWAHDVVIEVTRSSASHNHAGRIGGGLYVGIAQSTTITDSDVNDNNAASNGGGIWNDAPLTISGTSISRNVSASQGGGLYNSAPGTISNTTISGNHSDLLQDDSGGGIYQVNPPTVELKVIIDGNDLDLINVTIAENESDYGEGGGIFSQDSSVGLTNVLFANSTVTGAENNCATSGGSFNSNGHNLATDDGTDCGLTGPGEVLNAHPKLGAIQNNSGPSETQALKDGSDAIDNGDDDACDNGPVDNVDQRGFTRPFGASCDIGAYETGLADVAVISNVDNVDPVGAGGNVAYAIRVKNIGPSPDTATGVVLHNAIPAGTTFVSATSSQGSCSATACSLGSLPLGAIATVVVTVKTAGAGLITDTAHVTSATSDPDPSNDTKSQQTTVIAATQQRTVQNAPANCEPDPPRTSISRNGLDAKHTTIKLVGRTIDFRCAGQAAIGGIKNVHIAIALRKHGECKFLKRNGHLTKARDCDKPKFFKARLGEIRNGKVPWTFRIRHLDLPNGRFIAEALGTDSQGNAETQTRRFNRKKFRLR